MIDQEARWFDQVLKGKKTGVLEEPPVHVFVMGGGSGLRTDQTGSWMMAGSGSQLPLGLLRKPLPALLFAW